MIHLLGIENDLITVHFQGNYLFTITVLCIAEEKEGYAAKTIDNQQHLRMNRLVWYSDEQRKKERKFFCGTAKQEFKEQGIAYLADLA